MTVDRIRRSDAPANASAPAERGPAPVERGRAPVRRDSSFDQHDPAFIADPSSVFEPIRESQPLLHSDLYGGFWLLTRYEDVTAAALDCEAYTSAVPGTTLIPSTQPRTEPLLPLELDPPAHSDYRALVNPLFAKPRLDALRPHGFERPVTDMKGNLDRRDAPGHQFIQQRRREMEAGRWRSDGSTVSRVHRLVALAIRGSIVPLDIRWQRNVPKTFDSTGNIRPIVRPQANRSTAIKVMR